MPHHRLFVNIFTRKKHLLTLIVFVMLAFPAGSAYGQRSEIGILFGTSYYLGDLNPSRQFAMTRIAAGGLYRFNFNPHLSLRLNGILASVEGNDAVVKYNENRNLSFVSSIWELSLQGEVNFLEFEPGSNDRPYTPYLFGGAGIFSFNPTAEREGRYYDLQPLGTEGQGTDAYPERELYDKYSYSILLGIGFKFNITRHFTGGLEWGMRRTGTDYLDDVSTTYPDPDIFPEPTPNDNGGVRLSRERFFSDRSLVNQGENEGFQRGDPTVNDWYSFAGFVLTFKLPNFGRPDCPAFN